MPLQTVALDALPDDRRAVVFDGDPRVVRLALDAGDTVPPHTHPGHDVIVHVVEGAVTVTVDDDAVTLHAGSLTRFDGDRDVALDAEQASAVLVTLTAR